MLRVEKLLWDTWNVDHIRRHGVTPQQVEEVCHRRHLVRQTHADRLLVIGTDQDNEMRSIVLSSQGASKYYVVTARPAGRTERAAYRAFVAEGGNDV